MSDAAEPSEAPSPRARGRVLQAVNKTWPGFISGAVEGRARELIDQDQYEEAADVLEKGIVKYGPASVSQVLLAWCLHLSGRNEAALEWVVRAVEEEPDDEDAHWLRANVLFDLGRADEASAALWRAVELAPDNGRYYMQLAWFHYVDREFAKTRELVDQALERSPDDAWVQQTAGRIFDYHLRHKRAHTHYVRAFELDPDDAAVRDDLAEILQTRGRLSAGVRVAWETAKAAAPAGGDAAVAAAPAVRDEESLYEVMLRRWSWRWYERALRIALLLNVIDWIFPTPLPGSAVLAGLTVAAYGVVWTRSLLELPPECRRDLVGKGRRGKFAGALARIVVVFAAMGLVLWGELSALQHLGLVALLIAGYAEWYWRAARISGRRAFGADPDR
ncbi:tetratricopeptide repeat protein [Glycomyces luteolus]|uniref:Tetratricopeptide repeat protein n=1 Tax=Glycomyces luteolus TaxID=2670330 RepID=A0A9X3PG24_9ACTN|nr:tetratricopeptide repeat protein [Glycomyces luteolus]MDA1362813.1 tetratricopeptide repeat protein [Glycomyces luteolus]